MPHRRVPLLLLAVTALALSGCHGARTPAAAPTPAPDLLAASAAEMSVVSNARFAIEADGTVGGVALRRAGGVITREGDTKGTVQLEQGGALSELSFVVTGGTLYVKGPTGGWQRLPAAAASAVYDPSVILNQERGIEHVLRTATGARVEATEDVDGVAAYRVAARFDPQAMGALLPGIGDGVTGQVWIGADRPLLLRARFTTQGKSDATSGTVTITLSDFDQPVKISAP